MTGTAEAGSTVEVFADTACTGTPAASGTAARVTAPGIPVSLADGSHTLRAHAVDAAGNVSACSSSVSVTVDTGAPAAPVGLSVLPGAVSADATPILQGTAEAGSTVQVFVDAACTGTPHDAGDRGRVRFAGDHPGTGAQRR